MLFKVLNLILLINLYLDNCHGMNNNRGIDNFLPYDKSEIGRNEIYIDITECVFEEPIELTENNKIGSAQIDDNDVNNINEKQCSSNISSKNPSLDLTSPDIDDVKKTSDTQHVERTNVETKYNIKQCSSHTRNRKLSQDWTFANTDDVKKTSGTQYTSTKYNIKHKQTLVSGDSTETIYHKTSIRIFTDKTHRDSISTGEILKGVYNSIITIRRNQTTPTTQKNMKQQSKAINKDNLRSIKWPITKARDKFYGVIAYEPKVQKSSGNTASEVIVRSIKWPITESRDEFYGYTSYDEFYGREHNKSMSRKSREDVSELVFKSIKLPIIKARDERYN